MDGEKKGALFDRAVGLTALTVALIALFFSWQANELSRDANKIAELQVSPQITILSVDRKGEAQLALPLRDDEWGGRKFSFFSCTYSIRLANRGGAPVAIVGYNTNLKYADAVVKTDRTTLLTLANNSDFFYGGNSLLIDSDRNILPIPFQIDAFSAMDLTNEISFYIETSAIGEYHSFNTGIEISGLSGDSFEQYFASPYVEVVTTLVLSNGDEVNTQVAQCFKLYIDTEDVN